MMWTPVRRAVVAWLLVAATLAGIVGVASAGWRGAHDLRLGMAAALARADPVSPLIVVALAGAVLLCGQPPGGRICRAPALTGRVLVAVAVVAQLARVVAVAAVATPERASSVAVSLAQLLVEIVAIVMLPAVPRWRPVVAADRAHSSPSEGGSDRVVEHRGADVPPVPRTAPPTVPGVAGTVWRRAGDAATGAAGTVPPPASGWRPDGGWAPPATRDSSHTDGPAAPGRDDPSRGVRQD